MSGDHSTQPQKAISAAKAILIPLDNGENFCRYQWDDAGQRCRIEPLDQSGNGEISRQSHWIRYLWRAIEAVKSGLSLLDRSPAKESEVPWYMHTCNDCKKPLYGHLWLYDAETNRFIMNCPAPELQPIIDFLASAATHRASQSSCNPFASARTPRMEAIFL
jgi:hypothetical protein